MGNKKFNNFKMKYDFNSFKYEKTTDSNIWYYYYSRYECLCLITNMENSNQLHIRIKI